MLGGARAFDAIVLGHHAIPHDPTQVHPALTSFADECCGTLARLLAYVGVPALLAITGIHLWDELSAGEAGEPSAKAAGARLRGPIPRSPPVSLICLKRQRLTGFSASRSRPQGCLSLDGLWRKAGCRTRNLSPGSEFSQSAAVTEIATRMAPYGAGVTHCRPGAPRSAVF
jgi:hypothetical protein